MSISSLRGAATSSTSTVILAQNAISKGAEADAALAQTEVGAAQNVAKAERQRLHEQREAQRRAMEELKHPGFLGGLLKAVSSIGLVGSAILTLSAFALGPVGLVAAGILAGLGLAAGKAQQLRDADKALDVARAGHAAEQISIRVQVAETTMEKHLDTWKTANDTSSSIAQDLSDLLEQQAATVRNTMG